MGNIDIMNQRQRSILGIVLRSNADNSRRMEEDAIDVQIVFVFRHSKHLPILQSRLLEKGACLEWNPPLSTWQNFENSIILAQWCLEAKIDAHIHNVSQHQQHVSFYISVFRKKRYLKGFLKRALNLGSYQILHCHSWFDTSRYLIVSFSKSVKLTLTFCRSVQSLQDAFFSSCII